MIEQQPQQPADVDDSQKMQKRVRGREDHPPTPNPSPQLSPQAPSNLSLPHDGDADDEHRAKRMKTEEPLSPLTPPRSEQAPSDRATSGTPTPLSPTETEQQARNDRYSPDLNFDDSASESTLAASPSPAPEENETQKPASTPTGRTPLQLHERVAVSTGPVSSGIAQCQSIPSTSQGSKPRVTLTSLPRNIRRGIIIDAFHMSIPEPRLQGNHLSKLDPRTINPNFRYLFLKRQLMIRWLQLGAIFQDALQSLPLHPFVATTFQEVCSLAGNVWVNARHGKGRERDVTSNASNRDSWNNTADYRADPAWYRKVAIPHKTPTPVRDIILWMTRLPTDTHNLNDEEDRWPKWYLQDYMRFDLERIGVASVRVIAPNGAMLANVLCATVPIAERIKLLHFEIAHTAGGLHPGDERFFNSYRKSPATDHLCPRLSLHAPYLESLTLRNVCACEYLCLPLFRRLQSLAIYFVNANPGLCAGHDTAFWSETYWQLRALQEEVQRFRNMLLYQTQHIPRMIVTCAFDFLQQGTLPDGELSWSWQRLHAPLVARQNGQIMISEDDLWEHVVAGVKSLEDILRPDDDDEEDALSDDEELSQPDEDEDDEDWDERRCRVLQNMESVRQIRPAPEKRSPPPPCRPLRILG